MKSQKINTIFFDLAISIYIIWGCLIDVDPDFYKLIAINVSYVGLLSVFFSVISIIINYKFSLANTFILLFVIFNALYLFFAHHYIIVVPLAFLIFAAYNIRTEHIAKTALNTTIITTLCVILLCCFGFLPDRIYSHEVEGSAVEEAHSYGFFYFSGLSYRLMAIVILYLYLIRMKISLLKLLLVLLFSVFSYFVCTTRLSLVISLLFLVFTFFSYYKRKLFFNNIIWKHIGLLSYIFVMGFYFSFFLLSIFTFSDFFVLIDEILGKRLSTNIIAFSSYGVNLLGNKIEMVGAASTTDFNSLDYFYIDSGYVYWILAYGLLFTMFIIGSYSVIALRAWRIHNPFLYCWALLFAIANISNDFFTCSYVNISIFFLYADMAEKKMKKEKVCKKNKPQSCS